MTLSQAGRDIGAGRHAALGKKLVAIRPVVAPITPVHQIYLPRLFMSLAGRLAVGRACCAALQQTTPPATCFGPASRAKCEWTAQQSPLTQVTIVAISFANQLGLKTDERAPVAG